MIRIDRAYDEVGSMCANALHHAAQALAGGGLFVNMQHDVTPLLFELIDGQQHAAHVLRAARGHNAAGLQRQDDRNVYRGKSFGNSGGWGGRVGGNGDRAPFLQFISRLLHLRVGGDERIDRDAVCTGYAPKRFALLHLITDGRGAWLRAGGSGRGSRGCRRVAHGGGAHRQG